MLIIAEIGINHGGDFHKAKLMIERAKWAGADIAKFQYYNPEQVLGKDSPHFAEAKRCQFTQSQHEALKKHCDSVGIEYCVSVFHENDVKWADKLVKRFKVASRAALDTPLLRAIAATGKPVILSTGLLKSLDAIPVIFKDNLLTLLYCVCNYPTKRESLDFGRMLALKKYSPNIGFSSHCPDPWTAREAAKNGASCIEQHVTWGREEPGCDISSSITFQELKDLVYDLKPALDLIPVSTPEHIEWLRVQRSRPELYRYFRQDIPLTEDMQRRWWKSVDKSTIRLFIVHKDSMPIGYVGFNPIRMAACRAEFGIFILPEFAGKGYGTLALNLLLKKGFTEYNLSTIYSDVLSYPKEDRFSFYKKLGFEAFPPEHQTIRYKKQGKMVPSTKFFMTKDMWEALNGKNRDGRLEPVQAQVVV